MTYFVDFEVSQGHLKEELVGVDLVGLQRIVDKSTYFTGAERDIDSHCALTVDNSLVRFYHVVLRRSRLDFECDASARGKVLECQFRYVVVADSV